MIIYFYGNLHSMANLQKRFAVMVDILKKSGVDALSNLRNQESNIEEFDRIVQSGESMIEKVHGLVIEGTNQSFESAHLIALALTHKKPILYIVEKDHYIDKNLLKLQDDKQAKKYFQIQSYTLKDMDKILEDFVKVIEAGEGREKSSPSIKFTLRVTSEIEKYLEYKSRNKKISKADFLREKIEDIMRNDYDFKKFMEEEK